LAFCPQPAAAQRNADVLHCRNVVSPYGDAKSQVACFMDVDSQTGLISHTIGATTSMVAKLTLTHASYVLL
jgi:hypothetical protein